MSSLGTRALACGASVPCPPCLLRGPRVGRADADARALAALLDADPPLARRLMVIARSRGATSLLDAIFRMGAPRARLIVDALCWRERLGLDGCRAGAMDAVTTHPDVVALWRHSLACAHAAMGLAQLTGGLPTDDAWRMGLLHDLGERMLREQRLGAVAREGLPPPLAGAGLPATARLRGRLALHSLRHWELPAPMVLAIARHELPGRGEADPVTALLRVAHGLADELGHGCGPAIGERIDLAGARRRLGLSDTTLAQIRSAVQPRVEAMLAELATLA